MAFDWKELVKSVAPTLGTALGGPLAGAATKAIADKVLGDSNAPISDVENVILSGDPDALLKLKEAENDFKTKMAALNIDVFKLEVQDRASARDLFKVNHWPQIILSSVFVVGYIIAVFEILWLLASGSLKIASLDPAFAAVVNMMLGAMIAALTQILAFWFGSTQGSQAKTNILGNAVGK